MGLSQMDLLTRATDYATAAGDEDLAARMLRRDQQWLSRIETVSTGTPPFAELEALCAVLDLDPAKTAKGERA
jgi:hypothetical protein